MQVMKRALFLMLATWGITFSMSAGLYDLPDVQKVYVFPEDIQINYSSIYVWNKEAWIPVDAIHCDGIGLYYELYTFIDPILDHWDCPFCNSYNLGESINCYNCGWPWITP